MPGFIFTGTGFDDPHGKLERFDVAAAHATRLAIGDLVRMTGTASATGVAQVDAPTAGQSVTGVISGIVPGFATENFTDTGLAALTAGSVLVQCDPRAEYEVDVVNGPLVVADVGLNATYVPTAATNTAGYTQSNMVLNATGIATTSTLPFRIVKLLVGSDGVLGSRALVRLNESTMIAGATGV
jgi:hypothetical protein